MASHGLGPTRAKVMDLLQQSNAPLTASDVAEELDVHPNSARHHLGELVKAGYAERAPLPSNSTGRPRVGFTPTRQAPSVSDQHLVELTSILLEHFCMDDSAARQAGLAWGRKLATVDATLGDVLAAMGEAGFAPEVDGDRLCFGRCPFRARMSGEVLHAVCQVHLGYLQGALPGRELGEFDIGQVCTIDVSGVASDPTVRPEHTRRLTPA